MSHSVKRAPFIVIEGLDRSGKTTQTAALHARLQDEGVQASLLKFPGKLQSPSRTPQHTALTLPCPAPARARAPDRTTAIGQMIDAYLRSAAELDDRAVHLLFSANRWELASTIERTLRAGTPVVCDRYAFSGIAFSAAKVLPPSSSSSSPSTTSTTTTTTTSASASAPDAAPPLLAFEWCRAPDVGLPAPDLVLFLDIAPDQAAARGGYGAERYERAEMQARVRGQFRRIGEEFRGVGEGFRGVEDEMATSAEGKTRWVVLDAGREREVVQDDVWNLVGPLVKAGVDGPVGRLWTDRVGKP